MKSARPPEPISEIVRRVLSNSTASNADVAEECPPCEPGPHEECPADGRYDFDLAEFPLFRLNKLADHAAGKEPLRYTDTISGRDGKPLERQWAVYPGPFGFGGQSAQVLLFDLLQLYCEQGARGSQIQFGTLRSLFLRRGQRNPSVKDYDRLRRDFDILRGYDIQCRNAFWDSARQAYVDMNWRLFESVFYFRPAQVGGQDGQPYGFIEVSSVLRSVARTRGFFSLGFDRQRFYQLKPLEQRLAVYLAKHFTSQALHRRFVTDLARALPIEAARERDVRRLLAEAADGLGPAGLNLLGSFKVTRSTSRRWVAEFSRGKRPTSTFTVSRRFAESLTPAVEELVRRISTAVGSDDDRVWWAKCVETLGHGAVDRALGLLKEAKTTGSVRNPGGMLTTFFKKIAAENSLSLSDSEH